MAFSFPNYRIRLQSDYAVRDSIIDRLTQLPLRLPHASEFRFEIGIFGGLNGSAPSAISQVPDPVTDEWQSLTLTVQSSSGTNVISKTVGVFTLPTFATWNADTGQHCVISLTDAESNITPGRYRVALTLYTTTLGPIIVGTGEVEFYDAFNLNSSAAADENPGAPISQDAADLRYEPLGGGGGGGIFDAAITSWAGLAALDTIAPGAVVSLNQVKQFVVTGSLKTMQLLASTAATNLPFTQRPDDFALTTNEKVWINIG